MKKVSENWSIIFESGHNYDTLSVEVMGKNLRIKGLERSGTVDDHIDFFEEAVRQLKEYKESEFV